jgi:hypothetical protein
MWECTCDACLGLCGDDDDDDDDDDALTIANYVEVVSQDAG